MEARHTAGKWKVTEIVDPMTHDGLRVYVERPENEHTCENPDICQVYQIDGDHSDARYANAALISSAPNLLELVRSAYDRFTDNDMMPPNHVLAVWLEQARAAIAKAEGVRE